MNVFIVGSGRVGSDLAKMLSIGGHNVVILDTNPEAFKKLGTTFNGLTIAGSGTDEILLRNIKADKVDVFVTLTDNDNINIMSAQVAKFVFNIPKVIAKLTDPEREIILRGQDIGIVSGTRLISTFIWNEISIKPYKICYNVTEDAQLIRIKATNNIIGKTINDLNKKVDFIICSIIRQNKSIHVQPKIEIKKDDELLIIIKTDIVNKLDEIL